MVLFDGAPDPATSYPTTILTGVPFDECFQKCYTDSTCITSYGSSDSICYIYSVGDIVNIKKEDVGDTTNGGKVAMKIQENITCPSSASTVLEGSVSLYDVRPIKNYTFTSSKKPGYYSIDYGMFREFFADCFDFKLPAYTYSTTCNEWINPVPTCLQTCTIAMLSFRGSTSGYHDAVTTASTWKECIYACYIDNSCYMAVMRTYSTCQKLGYGNATGVSVMDSSKPPVSTTRLFYVAMKYIPDNVTCSMNITEIFNKDRTLKSLSGYPQWSAYRTKKTGTKSQIEWIPKAKTCLNPNVTTMTGVSGCYFMKLGNYNYSSAVADCRSEGGDGLMTIANKNGLAEMKSVMLSLGQPSGYFWIGLTRSNSSSPWVWKLPELELDQTGIIWDTTRIIETDMYSQVAFFSNQPSVLWSAGQVRDN